MSELDAILIDAARAAAETAYAPYSRFHVGAAVRLSDGQIVAASNVENASYGLSLCAEAVALAKIANLGQLGSVSAIAIAGGHRQETANGTPQKDTAIMPCGRCRQMLAEAAMVGRCDIDVLCATRTGHHSYRLSELLPHAFLLP